MAIRPLDEAFCELWQILHLIAHVWKCNAHNAFWIQVFLSVMCSLNDSLLRLWVAYHLLKWDTDIHFRLVALIACLAPQCTCTRDWLYGHVLMQVSTHFGVLNLSDVQFYTTSFRTFRTIRINVLATFSAGPHWSVHIMCCMHLLYYTRMCVYILEFGTENIVCVHCRRGRKRGACV